MAEQRKPRLVIPELNTESKKEEFAVVENKVEKIEEEVTNPIPPSFIPVKLLSNGRIKGIPEVLHFRDFSSGEALDLSTADEEHKYETIVKILNATCYEDIDVGNLTEADILCIMYNIINQFVSSTITQKIYINPDLPEGTDKGQRDNDRNVETVEVPIKNFDVQYLGTDENDEVIEPQIKVPFTLIDKLSGDKYMFKFPTINDVIISMKYVKEFYSKDIKSIAGFITKLERIQQIVDFEERETKLADFIQDNYEDAVKYKALQDDIASTTAKMIQALQIVSHNDTELETKEEKWNAYKTLPNSLWESYSDISEKYAFGIKPMTKVFSPANGKVVERPFRLEIEDFINKLDHYEKSDRYAVEFE